MSSSSSAIPTRRTSRKRLQLSPQSGAPPIPPRLRSSDMLDQIRRSSALRSPGIGTSTQGMPGSPGLGDVPAWFDHDEFSIQGPNAALSPVSTAAIHRQSPGTGPSAPSSLVTPTMQSQQYKPSPPAFASLDSESTQFPFPELTTNPTPIRMVPRAASSASSPSSTRKQVPP